MVFGMDAEAQEKAAQESGRGKAGCVLGFNGLAQGAQARTVLGSAFPVFDVCTFDNGVIHLRPFKPGVKVPTRRIRGDKPIWNLILF